MDIIAKLLNQLAERLKVTAGLSIEEFERKPLETSDTGRIQRAVNAAALSGKNTLILKDEKYLISGEIKIPSNISIIGTGKNTVFEAITNLNGSGHFLQVSKKENVFIQGICFDGRDFKAGAVNITNSNDITVSHCYSLNSTTQAFVISNEAKSINILFNRMERTFHGVQCWDAEDVLILGNRVNKVKGGLWHAVSRNIRYIGNHVQNCYDVGIDMEGGENCIAANNVVIGCQQGELAVFKGNVNSKNWGHNLIFKDNIVIASSTFIMPDGTVTPCKYGGLMVNSINSGASRGIVFEGNEIEVWGERYGIFTNELSQTDDCGIDFKNNTIHIRSESGHAHRIQSAFGVNVYDNKFIFEVENGSINEIKNSWNANIDNNLYHFKKGRSVIGSHHAVYLYTDVIGETTQQLFFKRNKFKGCGAYACRANSFRNYGKSLFVLEDNLFSELAEVGGGLKVESNYGVFYINQRLKIKVDTTKVINIPIDFPGLNNTEVDKIPISKGELIIRTSGIIRNIYSLLYVRDLVKSYDGSGSGSGAMSSVSYYATFNGAQVTFTMGDRELDTTQLDLVLNNFN